MSFEFEDRSGILINRQSLYEKPKGMVGMILKVHLAKDTESANKLLFRISLLILIVSLSTGIFFIYQNINPKPVSYKLSKKVLNKLPANEQINLYTPR